MKNNYKNESFLNRIIDKYERRNRGNIFLITKNYFFYFKAKIKKISSDKRAYILMQLEKNSIFVEVGVWKGDFSKKIWDISSPKLLVLVDSWAFDEKVRGCAPQVNGQEPLNQKFFDQAKNWVRHINKIHKTEEVHIYRTIFKAQPSILLININSKFWLLVLGTK